MTVDRKQALERRLTDLEARVLELEDMTPFAAWERKEREWKERE